MSIAIVISLVALGVPFMAWFFCKMCVEQRRGGLCRIVKLGVDPITLNPSLTEERLEEGPTRGQVIPIAAPPVAPNNTYIERPHRYANSPNASRKMWK